MHIEWLWKGAVLGFAIAAPVGPIGILTITRTLRSGRAAGLLTGLGAASADAVYGACAAFGLAALVAPITAAGPWLRYAGGAFLLYLGVRLVLARRDPARQEPASRPGGPFLSSLLLTLTNPMTILSFAALLGSFGVAGKGIAALSVVGGVFLGSMAWWVLLCLCVAATAARIEGKWLASLDRICGCTLAVFGLRAFFY